jgi:hypothetical protein
MQCVLSECLGQTDTKWPTYCDRCRAELADIHRVLKVLFQDDFRPIGETRRLRRKRERLVPVVRDPRRDFR